GDIFAYLAMNERASRAQVHQFWNGAWRCSVELPDEVSPQAGIPGLVRVEWRGMSPAWMYLHMPARLPRNWMPETANWYFLEEVCARMGNTHVEVEGEPLEIEYGGQSRRLSGFGGKFAP